MYQKYLLGGIGSLIFTATFLLAGTIGMLVGSLPALAIINFIIASISLIFISLGFRESYQIHQIKDLDTLYKFFLVFGILFGLNAFASYIPIIVTGIILIKLKKIMRYQNLSIATGLIALICGFFSAIVLIVLSALLPSHHGFTCIQFHWIICGFSGILIAILFFKGYGEDFIIKEGEELLIHKEEIEEPLIEESGISFTYKGQQIVYIIIILILIVLDIAFIIDILNPIYRNSVEWRNFWGVCIVIFSLTIIFTILLIRASKKLREEGSVRDYLIAASRRKKGAIEANKKGKTERAIIRLNKSIEFLEKGKIEANKYNPSLIPKIDDEIEIIQSYISNFSTETIISTEIRTPTEKITPPIEADSRRYVVKKDIILKRGGEIQGGKYIFKIKVENNSSFNITDLNFQIISYPRDSINLIGDKFREISKLNAGGLVSPTFEFQPTSDCIVGTIHSTVSYIDHSNNLHTEKVQPHEISIVCGLLQPRKIDVNEFIKVCQELLDYEKVGEEIKIPYNSKLIFEKLKVLLPDQNFMFVTNPESKLIGDTFFGEINGFAEGKFNKKCVGLKITITGNTNQNSSIGMIEVFAQDRSMLPSLISELSERIIYWYCKRCKGPLEMEDVEKLLRNELIKCRYCDHVMSKLL